jgi:hypothetical protein
MAGLRFAAVVVHLCLLLLSCSALRWLSDPLPESAAGQGHESYKTAYHFRPTENWQNGLHPIPCPCRSTRLWIIHSANLILLCAVRSIATTTLLAMDGFMAVLNRSKWYAHFPLFLSSSGS